MEVLLVRHAKSSYDWEKYPTDAERPLSKKGRQRQTKVAKGLKKLKLTFDLAWVSPYARAQETLKILREIIVPFVETMVVEELTPDGDEDKTLILLRKQAVETPTIRLLIVSHNPLVSSLLQLIEVSKSTPEMKTSDVALCEITSKESKLIKYYSREELMNN